MLYYGLYGLGASSDLSVFELIKNFTNGGCTYL